jgi:hypothetical protein
VTFGHIFGARQIWQNLARRIISFNKSFFKNAEQRPSDKLTVAAAAKFKIL